MLQGALMLNPEDLAGVAPWHLALNTAVSFMTNTKYNIRERDLTALGAEFVPFTAQTRMSGVNLKGQEIRKGSMDAIERYVTSVGGQFPEAVRNACEGIAKAGGTPLVVVQGSQVMGTIYLKDIVKGGIKERFRELRQMGIKTVMITGDNPLTAAVIIALIPLALRGVKYEPVGADAILPVIC